MCLAAHDWECRWSTPGNVKLLLPPRQSRGFSRHNNAMLPVGAITPQAINPAGRCSLKTNASCGVLLVRCRSSAWRWSDGPDFRPACDCQVVPDYRNRPCDLGARSFSLTAGPVETGHREWPPSASSSALTSSKGMVDLDRQQDAGFRSNACKGDKPCSHSYQHYAKRFAVPRLAARLGHPNLERKCGACEG